MKSLLLSTSSFSQVLLSFIFIPLILYCGYKLLNQLVWLFDKKATKPDEIPARIALILAWLLGIIFSVVVLIFAFNPDALK